MDRSGWLTAKRLRAQALLLAFVLWSLYVWTIATPGLRDRNGNLKGTDFLHFYTLGSLALEHRGEALYDMKAQAALAAERVPAAAGIQYLPLYPPQVSLLFAPLAYFSYAESLALWWAISVLLYTACCYVVWCACPNLKPYGKTVLIVAAGYPAFFHLIAWGQTSALALACLTGVLLSLRRNHEFEAGIALGLVIFKPQLAVVAAVLFFSLGAWRVMAGATLSAVAELSIGVLYYGTQSVLQWLRTLWRVREMASALEPRPYQTHSLRTFWSMLIPWDSISLALYIISAIVVLAWTVQVWRRSQSWELRFTILLLATVLVAPHLTVYDLVILAPAFLLLADWLLAQRQKQATTNIGLFLYLVYVLPLVGFLSRWTHLQLSVLAMTALAYQIWSFTRSEDHPMNTIPARERLAQI